MVNRAELGRRLKLGIVVVMAFAFPHAASAFAQQPQEPSRPFRGLFGANEADSLSRNALDLTFSLFGGYDDNTYVDLVTQIPNPLNPDGPPIQVVNPQYQVSGFFGGAQAGLDYRRRGRHVSFAAAGGSGFRYYPDNRALNGATPWETIGLSGALGSRTTFGLSQGVSYSPYYGFGVFFGLGALGAADYSLYRRPMITYTATADLTRQLSARSDLSFNYAARFTDFRNDPRSLLAQSIGVRYWRGVSESFGYHVGYAYRRGDYGNLFISRRPIQSHDLDVGVDYDRALDRRRRTTFGFSTGASVVVTPQADRGYVLGSAFLNHSLGRTWNVRLDYRRGVQFVEGFDRIFFTDAVRLNTEGYLGRRVDVSASAAYTSGTLGLGAGGQSFVTYYGTARLRVALSRYTALYTEYLYYHHLFELGTVLPPGIPRGLDRRGIRGGVMFWLPLLR